MLAVAWAFDRPDLLAANARRKLDPGTLLFIRKTKDLFTEVDAGPGASTWILTDRVTTLPGDVASAKLVEKARFLRRNERPDEARELLALLRSRYPESPLVSVLAAELGETAADGGARGSHRPFGNHGARGRTAEAAMNRRAALAALLLLAGGPASAAPPGKGIVLAACQLAHPIAAVRIPARCGTLDVPEDPAKPEGRKIALRVAVLPSENPSSKPDPVFVLAGGPGQSITEVYPRIAAAFDRLHRERDIVLVDQRGTGGSGLLSCPKIGRADRDVELLPAEAGRVAGQCARSLPADLTRYGTGDYVRDLDAVRAALGYDRLNLVGFSYGTRAALAYARAHPDRVRTLVLDGVAPFQMIVGNDFDVDSEAALLRLFARCADEPACRQRYPDLEKDFRDLIVRLDAKPEKVRARHPVTGEPIDLTVDGDALRQVTLAFLYAPETTALLPPSSARPGRATSPRSPHRASWRSRTSRLACPGRCSSRCSARRTSPSTPIRPLARHPRSSATAPGMPSAACAQSGRARRSTPRSTRRRAWRSPPSCSPARPTRSPRPAGPTWPRPPSPPPGASPSPGRGTASSPGVASPASSPSS